jgi:hypothetical protein
MNVRSKWIWVALAMALLGFALLQLCPLGITHALTEYLLPTTVQLMNLPSDCVPSNETPSPEALRIVEYQRSFYRLSFQKIVVCRTPRKFPSMEPDFTDQVFAQNTLRKWLPLYVGCCSYQYRRHVAVVISQQDERGALISQAALIQSRWDFLRFNWAKIGGP